MSIISGWDYAWKVLGVFFTLGIIRYIIDAHIGVFFYPYWYRFSRFKRLAEGKVGVRGFVVDQPIHKIAASAYALSTMLSVFLAWEVGFKVNPLTELIVWFFGPWAMGFGFIIGVGANQVFIRRRPIFDWLDERRRKAETFDTAQVSAKVRDNAAGMGARVVDAGASLGERFWRVINPPPLRPPVAPPNPAGSAPREKR